MSERERDGVREWEKEREWMRVGERVGEIENAPEGSKSPDYHNSR